VWLQSVDYMIWLTVVTVDVLRPAFRSEGETQQAFKRGDTTSDFRLPPSATGV